MIDLPRDFRLVDPVPIGDAELVDSNIIDALPYSTSAVDYDAWDASTTWALDAVTCWVYTPTSFIPGTITAPRFGVFKSKNNGNKNYEPAKTYALPYWTETDRGDVWDAGDTYASGDKVYRSGGSIPGIYTSLVNGNIGNTPESSPVQWSLGTIAAAWDSATTYSAGNYAAKVSAGVGYVYRSGPSGNLNHDPAAVATLPGASVWTQLRDVAAWDSTATYGLGTIVGRISGASGAIYQSLVAGNVGHDPAASPTYWQQTTNNAYEEWSGATTYAAEAIVCVFIVGRLGYVYRSLAGTNLNHAPGSSPTWWEFIGSAFEEWDSGETYAAGEVITDHRTHRNYESAQAANTGHDPTTDTDATWWIDLGATNRWKEFDERNGSQSSAGNVIDTTIRLPVPVNTLALLEVDAETVTVTVTLDGDTLYNETFEMFGRPDPANWYDFYFAPVINRRSVIALGLYVPAGSDIRWVASYPSNTARIGNALPGLAVVLGSVLAKPKVGIDDFSQAETNAFGDLEIVERAYRRIAELTVAVDPRYLDSVIDALASRRAKATLYIASDTYSSLQIYGFAKSFRGELDQPTVHSLPIELYALT